MKFNEWFKKYGIQHDLHNSLDGWERACVKEVARRAYKRGFKEGKNKNDYNK